MSAKPETANEKTANDNEVLYSVADQVATITLNRPERQNTISPAMLDQITEFMLAASVPASIYAAAPSATISTSRVQRQTWICATRHPRSCTTSIRRRSAH